MGNDSKTYLQQVQLNVDAVLALDKLDSSDPENAHAEADRILLGLVDPVVSGAYARLVERCNWWAHA